MSVDYDGVGGVGFILDKVAIQLLIGSGLFFYLVTNTAAWIGNPSYPRGLGGLWMSLTTGLPSFPPSWMFYRNALVSDLIFGALLLAVWALARRTVRENPQLHSA